PPEAYTRAASDAVYDRLLADAECAIAAGHSVVVDAVHARPDERARVSGLARRLGVPFDGFWLDAPLDLRRQRIGGRVKDASDADADVAKAQESYDLGAIDWHKLDAAADLDTL